ncbi:MAG: exo 1,3/1,4-beta-D-glucan glucohydrolase [Hyphomonadaceae bacterium]|nr:exo 1,3/1,4-beta-D-glucan glucohydrolase [Hyphomonadaceae bacterium]
MKLSHRTSVSAIAISSAILLSACTTEGVEADPGVVDTPPAAEATDTQATIDVAETKPVINPENWPVIETAPLDPATEARIDDILSKMTLEQKVGQVIQADSGSVTPEEVKQYRLGSVLSGGNSAPGPEPYADAQTWLDAADAYFEASLDPEGVEIAIPTIWGIDAVHGHANLKGAVVFPHNIGLGAANNPDLIEEIYKVTARELRVSGHDWTFAPTLAVPQNDRWGRTYEGFSESPDIVASYGDRIVFGLQGHYGDDDYLGAERVLTSAKHFVGDGGTTDGVDQGDTEVSEAELRDIHAAGYETAIAANAQTVMASFSAWNGERMHGQKELLTDVLKGRMNFNGFVVGDWNGHALIPGCTATDCPESFNAGVDMFMAPDSWKGLWESTYAHVQSGEISMERLDDAVRRILRVKINAGLFDAVKPSARHLAGEVDILGSDHHRAVARQSVRESLVLLKNNDGLLPLDGGKTYLIVGDGADSITKVAGGWTLSWQGGGYANAEFPNGETILSGLTDAISASGGTVIFDPEGTSDAEADVVIAVYGEDPYAEFQGDVPNLDFQPNGFDTDLLEAYQAKGMQTVSVFLSGRPMWTNPEINASDAFVAAWLPGSEGGGVADVLFQTDPSFDFTGRLSYSWPKLATQVELNAGKEPYDPLFALGYGLSYGDDGNVGELSEDSGLGGQTVTSKGLFFSKGELPAPWEIIRYGSPVSSLPFESAGLIVSAYDKAAQEDSLRVTFKTGEENFEIASSYPVDLSRESNGAMELVFDAKRIEGGNAIGVGMRCDAADCERFLPVTLSDDWSEVRLSLSCFADQGVDMAVIKGALLVSADSGTSMGVSNVRLEEDQDAAANCG